MEELDIAIGTERQPEVKPRSSAEDGVQSFANDF